MTIQIPLSKGKITIIDDIDADLSSYKWYYAPSGKETGYASRTVYPLGKGEYIHMHRVILERKIGRTLGKGEEPDHINGNALDNQRSNIRLSTRAQNNRNRSSLKIAVSKYKGVSFSKRGNKWVAQIGVDGKLIYLGRFADEIEAAEAYNQAAVKYFGEFARLNPLPSPPPIP